MADALTTYDVLAFIGVKLAGYSAAGFSVNRRARTTSPNPLVFGAARTVVGLLAVGVTLPVAANYYDMRVSPLMLAAALAPMRLVEWLALLWFFYTRRGVTIAWARLAVHGTAWSYFLDVTAVVAMLLGATIRGA